MSYIDNKDESEQLVDNINTDMMKLVAVETIMPLFTIFLVLFIVIVIVSGVKIGKLEKQINALQDEITELEHINTQIANDGNKGEEPTVVNIERIEINQIYQEPIEPTAANGDLSYTDDDLELLSHLISAEAGSDSCSYDLMLYTGSVVLNRIKHDSFPDDLYSVIHQPGQYACVNSGSINKKPTERACQAAEELLSSGSVLPDNVVFQAQFEQGDGVYIKEQNMYFCYKE